MVKKVFVLMLVLSTLISLTSCGLDYRYSLDENKRNQIELVWKKEDPSHIIYQGVEYRFAETDFLNIGACKDDVLLSWNGYRYFGYIDEYYSYSTDNPLFIYYKSWVFFRDGYDYLTDTFVIENTSAEIIWRDVFSSEQTVLDFIDPISVVLCSKQCPRIKSTLQMALIEDQWFIHLPYYQEVWTASDEFVKILSENEIIKP